MPRPRKKIADPEETEAAVEKAKAEAKVAAEEAKATAEKAKVNAEILKKGKELCAYLVTFCLHYHGCNVKSIFAVFQSYGLEASEKKIARCIQDNELLTYKDVLPADDGTQSMFSLQQAPEFTVEQIPPKRVRIKMTHSELPAIQSAALVVTRCPEGREITIEAAKKQIVFNVFCPKAPYPLEPLRPHITRCMGRALGIEVFPP